MKDYLLVLFLVLVTSICYARSIVETKLSDNLRVTFTRYFDADINAIDYDLRVEGNTEQSDGQTIRPINYSVWDSLNVRQQEDFINLFRNIVFITKTNEGI